MQFDFKDKKVLITNAETTIGSACVKELISNKATVIAHYFDSDTKKMADLVEQSRNTDQSIVYIYKADLTNRKKVEEMIDELLGKFGKIDVLIINNKVTFPAKSFIDLSFFDIDDGITKEIKSLLYVSQAVLKNMIKNKSGKIIIINNSFSKYAGYGSIPYSTSKSVIDAIAKTMALELSLFGISVNMVSPGIEETDKSITQIKDKTTFLISETLKIINFLILSSDVNGATFIM